MPDGGFCLHSNARGPARLTAIVFMDTSFIEVAGQACFTEQARHFPVSVQLEVVLPIADADDIHERFTAWDTRFTEAIQPLRSLFASIEDGGSKFDIKLDPQAQVV